MKYCSQKSPWDATVQMKKSVEMKIFQSIDPVNVTRQCENVSLK